MNRQPCKNLCLSLEGRLVAWGKHPLPLDLWLHSGKFDQNKSAELLLLQRAVVYLSSFAGRESGLTVQAFKVGPGNQINIL